MTPMTRLKRMTGVKKWNRDPVRAGATGWRHRRRRHRADPGDFFRPARKTRTSTPERPEAEDDKRRFGPGRIAQPVGRRQPYARRPTLIGPVSGLNISMKTIVAATGGTSAGR